MTFSSFETIRKYLDSFSNDCDACMYGKKEIESWLESVYVEDRNKPHTKVNDLSILYSVIELYLLNKDSPTITRMIQEECDKRIEKIIERNS